MKMADLGAGNVGGTLGGRFVSAGHEVVFGVPDPSSVKTRSLIETLGRKASAATVPEAAREADMIVLATPWPVARGALEEAGDLSGKIVVDCTNPLGMGADGLSLALGFDTSGGEQVARWARAAFVVKAFNQTGYGNMAEPRYGGDRGVMFVCGDDAGAREEVRHLAEEIGFDAVDAGPLRIARLLEPLAMLWIHLSAATPLGRDFAFALLRRPEPEGPGGR